MPKYKHGSGTIYRRVKVGSNGDTMLLKTWWLDYYHEGRRIRESSGSMDKDEARTILQAKLGQRAEGRLVIGADGVTFEELREDFLNDYKTNRRKTLDVVQIRVRKHLNPFFGGKTAHKITTSEIRAFIAKRQEEKASNGEINRELSALKRMFNLALQAAKIVRKPHIPMLEENNVRQGFFERWEFEAVLAKLPDYIRPVASFAYYTGWRVRGEILPLTWDRVDLDARTVLLYHGTTKNKQGRLIKLPQVLSDILERQWQEHLADYPDCPWVFPKAGKRMLTFYKVWRRACKEADLPGKLSHDFRRTAVRNLVRAGIPERVAMTITGHRTRAVFDRYTIVSPGDLEEAARKMDAIATAPGSPAGKGRSEEQLTPIVTQSDIGHTLGTPDPHAPTERPLSQ